MKVSRGWSFGVFIMFTGVLSAFLFASASAPMTIPMKESRLGWFSLKSDGTEHYNADSKRLEKSIYIFFLSFLIVDPWS
ncbi:uncharacterized protein F4822DRAFT_418113 [Hypoxylon trugodes]|uniref:uncharacterized protein n=1 Tax=Hypoxylon trugodes TaxID=326681 RepID=UPI00219A7C98|nr:uncharacterized protein F4822DRAFT_418113 [Hypoxylon trugodes]KAI1383952.1 hypothetical protein F4822DRAFT_418113 [Hypoxylon trugodes]